jgi:prepilin-type N-terminal cleavage/methylation domain-containing protein
LIWIFSPDWYDKRLKSFNCGVSLAADSSAVYAPLKRRLNVKRKKLAFTLVELRVAIAIIGVLIALLFSLGRLALPFGISRFAMV